MLPGGACFLSLAPHAHLRVELGLRSWYQSGMSEEQIGRNEPCPCGSGKKYKRCCGVNAAPKLTTPTAAFAPGAAEGDTTGAAAGTAGGFDPAAMQAALNPEWAQQFAEMVKRLPKGQMQRLQGLMRKAMAGTDVSREMAEFEKTLPTGFQSLLANAENQNPELKAQMEAQQNQPKKESKFSKFWKGMIGKK